jgi:hypothetical protein
MTEVVSKNTKKLKIKIFAERVMKNHIYIVP